MGKQGTLNTDSELCSEKLYVLTQGDYHFIYLKKLERLLTFYSSEVLRTLGL